MFISTDCAFDSRKATPYETDDPRNPRIISQVSLDDPESHSHKVRAIGDIMIV
ncbi:MAG: hypothetical protein LAO22_24140, partial [Acidobacteriia bacterium]|nr:hypothetical protein [Terriglobia bacterium]